MLLAENERRAILKTAALRFWVLGLWFLLLAACGSEPGQGPDPTATPAATTNAERVLTEEPEPATEPTAAATATRTDQAESSPGPDPTTDAPTTDVGRAGTATPDADRGSEDQRSAYEELLSLIPDEPEYRDWVFMEDFALVRATFDEALPGPEDSDETVQDFYAGLWLPPLPSDSTGDDYPLFGLADSPFLGPYRVMQNGIAGNLKYLGFDVRNMDHGVVAGTSGDIDDIVEAIIGRFSPGDTHDALQSCLVCPALRQEEHSGATYYRWGDDDQPDRDLALSPPAFDWLGRGGLIAVSDSYVLRTLNNERMMTMIDALQNETASLADSEEFLLLGAGASRLGAFRVMMSDRSFALDDIAGRFALPGDDEDKKAETLQNLSGGTVLLLPYQAFATGAGTDADGPFMALVLVHPDATTAEENAELLRTRIAEGHQGFGVRTSWTERVDIYNSEIRSEERLLLAKLRGPIARRPVGWVINEENLIISE